MTPAQIERRKRYRQRRRAKRKAEKLAATPLSKRAYFQVRKFYRKHVLKYVRRLFKKYLRKLDCLVFSKGMHRLRRRVWRRDHHTCQLCNCRVHKLNVGIHQGEKPRSDSGEVHHIESQITHPKLRYRLSNCVLLCHECHKLADWINLIQRQEAEYEERESVGEPAVPEVGCDHVGDRCRDLVGVHS